MSPTVVIAHGAGSTGDFARRAVGTACGPDARVVAIEHRSGDVRDIVEQIDAAAGDASGDLLVAGISIGAHATAIWAAGAARTRRADGLLLIMPAWTGPSAGARSTAAADIARVGVMGVLQGLPEDDWIADELRTAWPAYDETSLRDALEASARSRGPTLAELASIDVPVGLAALLDDPVHPVAVAEAWQSALPRAGLATVARHEPAADRSVLARAAMRAMTAASGSR